MTLALSTKATEQRDTYDNQNEREGNVRQKTMNATFLLGLWAPSLKPQRRGFGVHLRQRLDAEILQRML